MTDGLRQSFEDASAKSRALRTLEEVFSLQEKKIAEGVVPRETVPAVLKEMKNLIADVVNAQGSLSRDEHKALMEIESHWAFIRDSYRLFNKEIENAVLPYETATGRKTALPVPKNRFDL